VANFEETAYNIG